MALPKLWSARTANIKEEQGFAVCMCGFVAGWYAVCRDC
jgi:hypothetical protein